MKTLKYIILAAGLMLSITEAHSQLNPMGSIYYQNQYLANPAMAGIDQGWALGGGLKSQWTAINGAPLMEAVTLERGSENQKVGLGLLFYNDVAGVVQQTSGKATFAYHLPLNNDGIFLDFGLSAGVLNEYIEMTRVRGDLSDQSLYNFNARKVYFDADFGLALRAKGLTLQGALPNMKRLFGRDISRNVADRARFMAAASYKIVNENGVLSSIEPKVMFRGIQNYKNLFDAGANFGLIENKLLLSAMYHSTNSVTVGAGTSYKKQLQILVQYTTNTADLQGYSNGEAEIAIRYNFK